MISLLTCRLEPERPILVFRFSSLRAEKNVAGLANESHYGVALETQYQTAPYEGEKKRTGKSKCKGCDSRRLLDRSQKVSFLFTVGRLWNETIWSCAAINPVKHDSVAGVYKAYT